MKALAPVFFVLILLLALVSAVSAQNKIHNPELPKHLVFQWRIETQQIHGSWSNEDFSIARTEDKLVVYYGEYRSLEDALANVPKLPKSVKKSDVSLVPFFNQRSISAQDAFVLLGNHNDRDVSGDIYEEAVSFSVYFQTFETPQGHRLINEIDEILSFEVMPNYHYAYSAGLFGSLDQAEEYAKVLQQKGYPYAEVNKYLNGQKVAMLDEFQLYAYVQWIN